jgi:5-aminopentanamidase
MDVAYGQIRENIAKICDHLERLADQRVDLAVFPECALGGYCASCHEDADAISISYDRRMLDPIQKTCSDRGIAAVVGYAWNNGMDVVNMATLFRADEGPEHYAKTHIPYMGIDRFVMSGDDLPVFDTEWGKIGILICFDLRFPEAARTLALKGAELIVLITNWPVGAEVSADHIAIARAAENRVFLAACNRVGEERGFRFIGRSKIVSVDGQVLAQAGDGEEVVVAELNLSEAREKRRVVIPREYETDVFARKPELYSR